MTNEEINLAVAAIAGWTEIELWNTHRPEDTSPNPLRVYQGTNADHPELGKFIPNYVGSLDAIWKVFESLRLKDFQVAECSGIREIGGSYEALQCIGAHEILTQYGETPELALCKLLLAFNHTPIAPPQVAIIGDDGGIESPVFEAEFV